MSAGKCSREATVAAPPKGAGSGCAGGSPRMPSTAACVPIPPMRSLSKGVRDNRYRRRLSPSKTRSARARAPDPVAPARQTRRRRGSRTSIPSRPASRTPSSSILAPVPFVVMGGVDAGTHSPASWRCPGKGVRDDDDNELRDVADPVRVDRTPSTDRRSDNGPFRHDILDSVLTQRVDDSLSLNDIENRIVRPEFHDPRVHFALNCGAASCPALDNRAFHGAKLETHLDRQTKIRRRSRPRAGSRAVCICPVSSTGMARTSSIGSRVMPWPKK
ncbi:MAG TPA: hypothetical protein DIC52_21670, partial [Candidatus Latescibacteria bacterium]|nr:hypothetical protein [Candidatus Latescibacterota bacterium]